jgi:hypothetical protein
MAHIEIPNFPTNHVERKGRQMLKKGKSGGINEKCGRKMKVGEMLGRK